MSRVIPHTSFVTRLTLQGPLPPDCCSCWRRVFASDSNGLSMASMITHACHKGDRWCGCGGEGNGGGGDGLLLLLLCLTRRRPPCRRIFNRRRSYFRSFYRRFIDVCCLSTLLLVSRHTKRITRHTTHLHTLHLTGHTSFFNQTRDSSHCPSHACPGFPANGRTLLAVLCSHVTP